MKKIKLFPAPHVEVRVSVTDEMVADLRECDRMSEHDEIKDCDTCSWREVEIGAEGVCGFLAVLEQVKEDGEMERLTQKDEQGNWILRGALWESLREGQVITKELWERLYGALWKLMEYEDTGLSPEEVEQLKENQRWIPVEERLPEPYQED